MYIQIRNVIYFYINKRHHENGNALQKIQWFINDSLFNKTSLIKKNITILNMLMQDKEV